MTISRDKKVGLPIARESQSDRPEDPGRGRPKELSTLKVPTNPELHYPRCTLRRGDLTESGRPNIGVRNPVDVFVEGVKDSQRIFEVYDL